ncbi:putative oxidoreductase [Roseivirga ehrenbergii]|uniref:Oxidoreductase n=1 Tax=Roseivirga ehrenbergii (strain DSM 102268 / JCM 13514 / KCTC 12282 / NCIMB 14502 / KMM 6017) TaxID=279360 RepID=A0A150XT08_ROSEK|nr:SDR family NAD(P)-dependent oxidoreductase [Roseivirga ehrenbergii]KYG81880.1 oxidoreductase [Roseivirga ehrenbergii]TCL01694.1 putative oxidoreductase [Roseivirga ehrenbergii]
MKFENNTVLITGGSSGVGLELAQRLIQLNNKVLICGSSLEKLERTKAQMPSIDYLACDLSEEEGPTKLFDWIKEKHPTCNVLVNNAAITHTLDFHDTPDILEVAKKEIQVNLMAPIALTKLFSPLLEQNPNPAVINITSGLVYSPRAVYPFYSATKAALHSFTQVLRIQSSKRNLEIIEILLPVVNTPWHKGNPPKIAITVEKAVEGMLKGLRNGQSEIKVAGVKILYALFRIAPSFALKKINSLGSK